MGQIITFYSYKGGVGRSMALANVGVLLAQWGHRVLLIDWDLEAPGLEAFFHGYIDLEVARQANGLIEILTQEFTGEPNLAKIDWTEVALPVLIPNSGGTLGLITAGKQDNDYFHKVKSFDFDAFYMENQGGFFVERLRNAWKDAYDFILVDSRTGITDIGGICTVQLPDILVLLFTATRQSFDGIVTVAENAAAARQKLPFERLSIPVIPIANKFDSQAAIPAYGLYIFYMDYSRQS